ncbi:MAG: sensor histidine kinase [Acidimicrobiales bacterium]
MSRSVATLAREVLRTPFSRRARSEQAYLLVSCMVTGMVAVATVFLLVIGLSLLVFCVGVLVLAFALVLIRSWGDLHRSLAAAMLDEHIPGPPIHEVRPGLVGWLRSIFGDGRNWRTAAYLVVSLPLHVLGTYLMVIGWVVGLIGVTYPVVWQVFDPTNTDAEGRVRHSGMQFGDTYVDTWPRAVLVALAGATVVLAIPWVVRGVVNLDRLLMRPLLGPWRLSERVRDLEQTRSRAVDDAAAALRRIERDLHDGTQARLVAMAMQLDMAKEALADNAARGTTDDADSADLGRARDLVETAHRNAVEAITELRDVTRNIHPPALDRGLDAALATLAARAPVPTRLRTDVRTRPTPAIETIAYFCVAELLTNVARHSQATEATVRVTQGDDAAGLRITVGDDGVGGASIAEARGLAGLAERVRTVDGRLDIASPPGGPTLVTVVLPASA